MRKVDITRYRVWVTVEAEEGEGNNFDNIEADNIEANLLATFPPQYRAAAIKYARLLPTPDEQEAIKKHMAWGEKRIRQLERALHDVIATCSLEIEHYERYCGNPEWSKGPSATLRKILHRSAMTLIPRKKVNPT